MAMFWGQTWQQRHDGLVVEISSIEAELDHLASEWNERAVVATIGDDAAAAPARQAIDDADAKAEALRRRLRELRPTLAHCAAKLAAEQSAALQREAREKERRIGELIARKLARAHRIEQAAEALADLCAENQADSEELIRLIGTAEAQRLLGIGASLTRLRLGLWQIWTKGLPQKGGTLGRGWISTQVGGLEVAAKLPFTMHERNALSSLVGDQAERQAS